MISGTASGAGSESFSETTSSTPISSDTSKVSTVSSMPLNESDSDETPLWVIVLSSVIPSLLIVALGVVIAFVVWNRKRRRSETNEMELSKSDYGQVEVGQEETGTDYVPVTDRRAALTPTSSKSAMRHLDAFDWEIQPHELTIGNAIGEGAYGKVYLVRVQ